MSMSPSQECNIWDFEGNKALVKVITLGAWHIALKAEVKGLQVAGQPVEPIVRKFLKAPDDYPIEDLSAHITTSYECVKEQMGI